MNIQDAVNDRIAILLWAKDINGEDDVCIYSGTLIKEKKDYSIKCDHSPNNIEIREEWLSRIKIIPDDLKETLLNCNYQISLSVGDSSETDEDLESFGLKWRELSKNKKE